MIAEAAKALGAEFAFLTPESFRTIAMPSYRDLRVALPRPAKIARLIERGRPDTIHIATEGPIGLVVAALLPQARLAVHDELPHPLSRLCLGARAGPGILGVGDAALVSWREPRRDGGDASAGAANCASAASATSCCGRAASIPACSARARSISACRSRCFSASAASRSKRISRRFSISICPAPR